MSMDVEDCYDAHLYSVHNNDKRSRSSLVLEFSSYGVHVCGRVVGYDAPRFTIDVASDVPCIAFPFIARHPVLKHEANYSFLMLLSR